MGNLLIPESEAHVVNWSEDAACRIAAKHRHGKVEVQDTNSTDIGPPQPPIPNTTSPRLKMIYLRLQRYPLKQSPMSWTRGGGGRRLEEVAHAAGHGNVYVSSRSPLTVFPSPCPVLPQPLEVVHNLQQTSSRPSPRLILHPLRSRKQPHRCFSPRGVKRLQLRGLAGGERLRCPLAGTE